MYLQNWAFYAKNSCGWNRMFGEQKQCGLDFIHS